MFLLDTDTLSYYLRRGDQYNALRARVIAEIKYVATSVITIEEYLHYIAIPVRRARSTPSANEAYAELFRFVSFLHSISILEYDSRAQAVFDAYPSNIRQHNREDARIAAIAIINECIVVTNNTADFDELGVQNTNWIVG